MGDSRTPTGIAQLCTVLCLARTVRTTINVHGALVFVCLGVADTRVHADVWVRLAEHAAWTVLCVWIAWCEAFWHLFACNPIARFAHLVDARNYATSRS